MKFVRIFLLVLIIIGIILLLTQNLWVPKIVDMILRYESSKGSAFLILKRNV